MRGHLISHFVTASPQGEALKRKKFLRKELVSTLNLGSLFVFVEQGIRREQSLASLLLGIPEEREALFGEKFIHIIPPFLAPPLVNEIPNL